MSEQIGHIEFQAIKQEYIKIIVLNQELTNSE
jgi:hypothetical protein